MVKNKKKKVLIIGSSAKEYSLVKYFSRLDDIEEVFIAPGNVASAEYATRVDIRENAVSDLLEFAIKNDIDLTVAPSRDAIKADIAQDFRENSQPIFAPDASSANISLSRSIAKKFLYKQHISTPKFGTFEKQQMALDYLKTANYPLLISTDYDDENSPRAVCNNAHQASVCINDAFSQGYSKVVIEEYTYGHSFTFYVITDGYQALPIGIACDYKFREDGNGGLYTQGMGTYVPDYKISFSNIEYLMNKVVYPVLNALQAQQKPYIGILGFECVLKSENDIVVVNTVPFLKDHDAQAVINGIDTNIYDLMLACANGSFADDYEDIPIKDIANVACVLYSRKANSVVTGLELIDDTTDIGYFSTDKNKFFETLTNEGRTIVVTQSAGTFSRARELLYENVDDIYFDGIKYRHDICAE